jgi:hypothetical protein
MKWDFSNNKLTNLCFHIKHQQLTTLDSGQKEKIMSIHNFRSLPPTTRKYLQSNLQPYINNFSIVWVRNKNSSKSSIRCWPSTRPRTQTIRWSLTILCSSLIARLYRTPRYSTYNNMSPKSIPTPSSHKMKVR